MFGTLKPAHHQLDAKARGEWQRLYCGTCQSLGQHFGHAHRGLLSHDAVFLATLVDGLQDHAGEHDRCRCPLIPVVHRPTISPDSIAMRYAASVQILLADQWLADRAIDGRSLAGAARSLLTGASVQARQNLSELGSSLAELEDFELRQAAAELPGTTGPREAAEPTAAALGLVFERVAELPSQRPDADARAWLARLGRSVGTTIYVIDALEDLEADLRERSFNPCLVHDFAGRSQLAPARVREACTLLDRALVELGEALELLPLRRHRALLHNVLLVQLRSRATRAMAEARVRVAEGPRSWWTRVREQLEALGRRAPLRRLVQGFSAALLASATVTWSRVVAAQPAKSPKHRRKPPKPELDETTTTDTGTQTGTETDTGTDADTDTASDTAGDTLDAIADKLDLGGPAQTPVEPSGSGGGGCPCCTWFGDLMNDCCGSISGVCTSCGGALGDCGGACSGLGECIGGCGNGCNGQCSNCGNACSGCGDCGNSCSGCGNGCSGCGNCGNGCSGCGNCGNSCGNCGNCGGGGCGGGGGGCNC